MAKLYPGDRKKLISLPHYWESFFSPLGNFDVQKHVNNIINTNLQFFSAPVRHKSETVGRVKPEMGTRFFYLVALFSLNIGKAN